MSNESRRTDGDVPVGADRRCPVSTPIAGSEPADSHHLSARDKFAIGDRVRKVGGPEIKRGAQMGVVTGFGRNNHHCVRVHIDGTTKASIYTWHMKFWEVEPK